MVIHWHYCVKADIIADVYVEEQFVHHLSSNQNVWMWSSGKDSSVTLRVHAVPPPNFLKPSRFHPQKNNIRTEWFTGVANKQGNQKFQIGIFFKLVELSHVIKNSIVFIMQNAVSLLLPIITTRFLEITSLSHTYSSFQLLACSVLHLEMVWPFSKFG